MLPWKLDARRSGRRKLNRRTSLLALVVSLVLGACAVVLAGAPNSFSELKTRAFSNSAGQHKLSKPQIQVSKVAGNVYMLVGTPNDVDPSVGDDSNIGVYAGDDGIVMVDDQEPPMAAMIQAALKGISDKPLRFVINTHYHDDHVGENAYFQRFAPIIAPTNLRKRLKTSGVAGNGATQPPVKTPVEALPIITFDHELTLHVHGEDIHIVHFPAAHTDGDAVVFFPKSNVVHMGDIFVTYGFPSIDVDAGGSVDGMIDAVEKVIAQVPADVKVIPGHGSVSTVDDMRAYVTMLKEMQAAVRKAIDQGQTLEQMQHAKLLEPWKGRSRLISPDNFLKTMYRSLTR